MNQSAAAKTKATGWRLVTYIVRSPGPRYLSMPLRGGPTPSESIDGNFGTVLECRSARVAMYYFSSSRKQTGESPVFLEPRIRWHCRAVLTFALGSNESRRPIDLYHPRVRASPSLRSSFLSICFGLKIWLEGQSSRWFGTVNSAEPAYPPRHKMALSSVPGWSHLDHRIGPSCLSGVMTGSRSVLHTRLLIGHPLT